MPKNTAKAPKPASSPVKTAYLILYNAVSAIAWGFVLTRTVTTVASEGTDRVFLEVGESTKWIQTMAGMEVLHSLFGKMPLLPRTADSHTT